MSDYNPSLFYNAKGDKRLVRSVAEQAALGREWHDSPDKAAKAAAKAAAKKSAKNADEAAEANVAPVEDAAEAKE